MKKIVILGNGFDLAHGLETKYEHFVKYIINESINYNEDIRKELIDVASLQTEYKSYKYISENFDHLLRFANKFGRINFNNSFFRVLIEKFFTSEWFDIEQFYFHVLTKTPPNRIDNLQTEFETIKRYLQSYLTNQVETNTVKLIPEFMDIFYHDKPDELIFINFNYTNTIQKYINTLPSNNPQIINIHGALNSEINPIIFGYGDDSNDKYIEIVDNNNNKYLRNFKRQQYNLANQYEIIKQKLLSGGGIEMCIIGHSLAVTDKSLLKEIFENKSVVRIKLFYFRGREGYRNLNDNIRRIVNDSTFRKVVNFPNSIAIPQLKKITQNE